MPRADTTRFEPLTQEEIDELLAPADPKKPEGPNLFESMVCSHCGGAHRRACPRVKRMTFEHKGEIVQIREVEFWPDNEWPKDHVIFPEEVYA